MTRQIVSRSLIALAIAAPATLAAQQPAQTSTTTTVSMPIEFSGLLFPQFIYGGPKGNGTRSANQFQLERAYLTAKAKIADRTSIRLTSDIFRPGAGAGYTMRAKYAFVQYDYWMNNQGFMGTNAQARLGMQQTVIIEQDESFWPRYIAKTAVERAGFFSASDLGLSTTIGNKRGEVFAMVSNGPGYAQPEVDRFKDWQFRLTVNPIGNVMATGGGLLISPWYYKGTVQSGLRPAEGRKHDRYGVLAGWKSPVFTLGGQVAKSTNENEALNAGNVVTTDRSTSLVTVYTVLKPLAMMSATGSKAWGVVLRYDKLSGDNGYVPNAGDFAPLDGHFLVAGLTRDVNSRLSLALDYQQGSPEGVAAPNLDTRTYNLHASVAF
ncbi:MAG: hypothetical protein HOQ11_03120 [Gemmatimonadaceae bacterium]|nr:hypothetical protein [Gemmatimonadaceae bacterium]NUQ93751.1 hypothetical protein [Gemmatimonadaceae bacterium]NUR21228.1 hypothetical protein [Gemmatimonadaceae bacterium]NUS96380.1 hypothetical protein [Gemmatimonadaceae bacterium]